MTKNNMNGITVRQFQPLCDCKLVWDLMIDDYEPLFENGVAAPFFEYALTSSWMDKSLLFLDRLWLDGEKAVGFVFYEDPKTAIFFHLRRGYEFLAEEMIAYADSMMPGKPCEKDLNLFPGQKALIESAGKLGYSLDCEWREMVIDMDSAALDYPLPDGYHFVDPLGVDPVKFARCTWYGFDHGDKGEFVNWDEEDTGGGWTPRKAYLGILGSVMAPPPHLVCDYNVFIADANGDYVCYSGMWFVKEKRLAYMEPLCTVPGHRHKGLAAAALTAHYKKLKPLGARFMTGGDNEFYRRIGYNCEARWLHYKKGENHYV